MRSFLLTMLIGAICTSNCLAEDASYKSGVGLITVEAPTGLFLNPTSGTPAQGTVTAQVCGAALPRGSSHLAAYRGIATYAVTNSLELGGHYTVGSVDPDSHVQAFGPQGRYRILEQAKFIPEITVGGYTDEGDDKVLRARTAYAAAFKSFALDENGIFRSVGTHAGFRYRWQDSDVNEANGAIGYGGVELELPRDIFLIAETSLKDDLYDRTPYSYGLQVRRDDGIGFSLAAVQTGFESRAGIYIGVGINFI